MRGKQAQALIESIIVCGHPSVFAVLIPAGMCRSLGAPVTRLGLALCRAWVLFSEPLSDAHRNKTGMNFSSSSKMQVVFYLMFDMVLLCTCSKCRLIFYVTDWNCWCFLFSQGGLATRCVSSSQQLWVSPGWSVVVSKFSTVLKAFKIWLQVGVFPKEYSWIGWYSLFNLLYSSSCGTGCAEPCLFSACVLSVPLKCLWDGLFLAYLKVGWVSCKTSTVQSRKSSRMKILVWYMHG